MANIIWNESAHYGDRHLFESLGPGRERRICSCHTVEWRWLPTQERAESRECRMGRLMLEDYARELAQASEDQPS